MKYLSILLAFCYSSSFAQATLDTLFTSDNKFYIAKSLTRTQDSVTIMLRDGNYKSFAASYIQQCSEQQLSGIRAQAYLNKPQPVSTPVVDLQMSKLPSTYFKRSAGLAGAGIASMIFGGIVSAIEQKVACTNLYRCGADAGNRCYCYAVSGWCSTGKKGIVIINK
jgi:hypothetical protein